MTPALDALLSAGVPIAALVLGFRAAASALDRRLRESWVARTAAGLGLGVAAFTPILVALAASGWFATAWLGALGWAAAAASLSAARRSAPRGRLPTHEAVVLVAAGAFTLVAASGRDESIGGGRDQQVYAQFAVQLAHTGSIERRVAGLDAADRELLARSDLIHLPGAWHDRNIADAPFVSYLPFAWSAWLAFAYAIGSFLALYSVNALVFAWGALLLFTLARCFAGPTIATGAMIAFLALPSSLWAGAITLSEPLAMSLLLCVPLLTLRGFDRTRGWLATVLVAAGLVRIDSMIVLPAIAAAAALPALVAPVRARIATAWHAMAVAALAFLATAGMHALFNRAYVQDNLAYLVQIGAALAGTVAAFALVRLVPTPAPRRVLRSRAAAYGAAGALVLLFAYAALVRPGMEPYSLIVQASWLNGTRDFREESVRNLAVYLSWPLLLAALGGAVLVLARGWLARGRGGRALIVILALGPALLYLWFPHVSPDHPWAVRRFVPMVIPLAVLLAALLVAALARRTGAAGRVAGMVALVAAGASAVLAYPSSTLLYRDNRDLTRQVAAVARGLPDELVVSIGLHEAPASALLLAFGKPVITVDAPTITPEVERWAEAKAALGRSAWLLHGPEIDPPHASRARREWLLTRRHVAPSNRAPAAGVTEQSFPLTLSALVPPTSDRLEAMFGADRVWGVGEGGFHNPEIASFGKFRFTSGKARIALPAATLVGMSLLKLDLFTYADVEVRREVRVAIGGVEAWRGEVPGGVSTLRVAVPPGLAGDTVTVALDSETVDLAKDGILDRRNPLGVGVIGIRALRAADEAAPGPGIEGFRSQIALLGPQLQPVVLPAGGEAYLMLELRNTGAVYWPVVREFGGPQGAVQIAVRWHKRGAPGFVADNRVPLAVGLYPEDRLRLRAALRPTGPDGKTLPPGDYEVRIGMVREGVALFADNGDRVLEIPVRVEAP